MLMILVTAFASSRILGEKINKYWTLAFATSLGGCLVIIVHVPKEPHIYDIETFLYMITAPMFLAYNAFLLVFTVIMIRFTIPKWGQVNSVAYTLQSAIFGSIIVVALKGVLLVFTDKFFHWVPLICVLAFEFAFCYSSNT
ncbi:magnesium transporter NIPA2 [Caerostris extrusa]|uniref:Magnesium transporter NIPA2 n=1 Tax=Caerostris extrusa TaxID=172846 RepID=A0AAV4QYG8_CAEEX|nr:magnesium transporter NIPA2 [Caerostris extrusa]